MAQPGDDSAGWVDPTAALDLLQAATYDRLAGLAARLLGTPIAIVSLFDRDEQRFVGRHGTAAQSNTLDQSFCQYLTAPPEEGLIVPDARLDERFAGLNGVSGRASLRFYAGQPILRDNAVIGSVCVFDRTPRTDFDAAQLDVLRDIADLAMNELQRQEALRETLGAVQAQHRNDERLRSVLRLLPDVTYTRDAHGALTYLNPAAQVLHAAGALPGDQDAEARALETAVSVTVTRTVWASGHPRTYTLTVVPEHGADGTPTGTLSVARETTGTTGEGAAALIEAQVQARTETLVRLAFTDALTGLGNRRAMEAALEEHLVRYPARTLHLCLTDLNDFKSINDQFGHERGDQALVALADALRAEYGSNVYRLGGDEFVILQPGREGDTRPLLLALHDEQDLLGVRTRAVPRHVQTGSGALSVSLGIASAPVEGRTATDLLRLADERMLHEKTRRHASQRLQQLSGRAAPPQVADLVRETLQATLALLNLNDTLTPEIYQGLLSAGVASIREANAGSLYMLDGDHYVVVAQVGFTNLMVGLRETPQEARVWYGETLDWQQGRVRVLTGAEVMARSTHALRDDTVLKGEVYHVTTEALRATMCVPIVSEHRVVGYVNFDSFRSEDAFGPGSQRAAEEFAVQLAAVYTARARARREQARQQEIEVLLGMNEALHRDLNETEVLQTLMEQTGRVLASNDSALMLTAADGTLQEVYAYGWLASEEGGRVARDLAAQTARQGTTLQAQNGTHALLSAALPGGSGGPVAVVIGARSLPASFSAQDLRLLTAVASTGATALGRVRTMQALSDRAQEVQMLSELTLSSLLTTDPEGVALDHLRACAAFFGASGGGYHDTATGRGLTLDGRTLHLASPSVLQPGASPDGWRKDQTHGVHYMLDHRQHENPDARLEQLGARTIMMAQVIVNGTVRGQFGLWWDRVLGALPPAAPAILGRAAELVSLATERRDTLRQLDDTREGALMALGLALELRDFETSGHTQRVVALAEAFGQELRLPESELEELRQGAYLHDIGKLAVPDAILLKPGPLTPAEWSVMQAHTVTGADLGARIPALPQGVLNLIRHHHERWDGSGYPAGLSGGNIPLLARLFSLVDTYDALTSVRPYKHAWTPQEARQELRAQAGRQFDPALTEVFLHLLARAAASRGTLDP
ncbi:HD domain-containing phosphohydrolase [Deinococcus aquiradiocola]|nr:HD domain-containing phosphohydrolase [Deinococcus aquiradiocola]